ncbi:hypothetical protein J4413_02285 [Candidatus Woesearchaeota archaeon]|nr:hypothetical protein [Candidatus Woesearchaeota archaeon]
MKDFIIRALIIFAIIVVIQVITDATYGVLGILVALVIGFVFSGIAEAVSKISSGKK